MKLPEFGVRRPVFTTMIFLGLVVLGVASLVQLPIDLLPKIELPTMTIVTMYRGASPEDIESKVTKIIEERVSTVPNVKEVTSVSEENISAVTVRFEWGTDMNEAAADVRERLDIAERMLPEDVEKPMLIKMDPSLMPIMVFGVTAKGSYPKLKRLMEKKFCEPLERVPGVAMAIAIGGPEREIQVDLDRDRLRAYHLSVSQITGILAAENLTLPAGNIKVGKLDYTIRVPGEFRDVAEVGDVIVGNFRGIPVHLKDVAEVKDSFKRIDRRVRVNGEPGLIVLVQKQSGANTVEVARRVREALPELQRRLPPDVKIATIFDSSEFIVRSINNLLSTIGWALLFVMLVVFFFLREIRGSIIIATTIPVALICAFIFLFAGGYTINVMSLAAIAIALGMVVDNAIVIYENIYRHRTEGESPREASIFGASEVGTAVMASTFTTVAIFFPIIFVKGITGILFKELGIAVMIVMAASLFTALTLTPMLSSQFMRIPSAGGRRFHDFSERWFRGLEVRYRKVLRWALDHRKTTVAVGLGVFLLSLAMLKFVGTELMPAADQGWVQGVVKLPVGTRIEETDKVMAQVERLFQEEVPEREMMFARCGVSETGIEAMMGQRSDTYIIHIGANLVPKDRRKRSDREIALALSRKIRKIPGVVSVDFSGQDEMQAMMTGGLKPVTVEIYGYDIARTDSFAAEVKKLMEGIPGLTDVTISREKGRPEIWVEVDRRKAAALGLNMATIASTLRTKFYGQTATKYREGGDEYDVFVKLRDYDRQALDDIGNTFVTSLLGGQVPIRNIARIVRGRGPIVIERKDQARVVYVGANYYGRSLGGIVSSILRRGVVSDLKKGLEEMGIPEGIDVKIGGSAKEQAESFKWLGIALVAGILLVYMVMAAQFESFVDPFVILFSIPFAVTGVIWALLITGKTLNIISFVGMIMLVGIVVNNAIVLVDYINIMRARGFGLREAILVTGPRRLRPVLMTAFTTIFALLPLALRTGEGSELWSPLAVSVIGGLLVSTLVTLVFVPVMYSIFEARVKRHF